MALVKLINPHGVMVRVPEERLQKLLSEGFLRPEMIQSYANTLNKAPTAPKVQPKVEQPTAEPEVVEQQSASYSIEKGEAGWYYVMRDGERVETVRGEDAAREKLAELSAN